MSCETRLLLVDDDRDFAESLSEVLDLSGYAVEVVFSGDEAINRCLEDQFDLVLMDVRMPGKDGVQSLVELKANNPDCRVILMTAYAVPDLVNGAIENGARAVIPKPLPPDRLIPLIEEHRHQYMVLLVDDDPDFADAVATALRDANYAVSVAANGESALDQASTVRPTAIILDLRLPDTNGLAVLVELKRRELLAPTVVVSAYMEEEGENVDKFRAGESSVAGVLEKPFPPADLLSLLEKVPRTAAAR